MTNPNWKNIPEFIGITAIVASLIFVGVQLSQDREVALSGVSQSGASSYTEIQIAIADHAEILAKSNRGEKLSDSELIVMNALVAAMNRHVVINTIERRKFGGTGNTGIVLFASWLYQNPGARAVWTKSREDILRNVEHALPGRAEVGQYTNEVLEALERIEKPRR